MNLSPSRFALYLIVTLAAGMIFGVLTVRSPAASPPAVIEEQSSPSGQTNATDTEKEPSGEPAVESFTARVPDGWRVFEELEYGFSISFPNEWIIQEGKLEPRTDLPDTLLISYVVEPPGLPVDGVPVSVSLYREPITATLDRYGGQEDGVTRLAYDKAVILNSLSGRLQGTYNGSVRQEKNDLPIPTGWTFYVEGGQWTATVGASPQPTEMWEVITSFKAL